MKKNPLITAALRLLKEWQEQLGQGDRPDLDALVKELEEKQHAIVLDVPRGEVTCLLVAISNHAHNFGASAARERKGTKKKCVNGHENNMENVECWIPGCGSRTFSKLVGERLTTIQAWERHGYFLENLKADIRRQTGVK